jgi:hypothetical protein
MERDSRLSFDSDRQVKRVFCTKFEKPKAFVTLEKLVGKEPDVHSVDLRPCEYVYPAGFSSVEGCHCNPNFSLFS